MKITTFWRRNLTVRLICTFLLFSLLIVSFVGNLAYFQATDTEEISIIDLNGTILVSSDKTPEGQSVTTTPYFSQGRSKTFTQVVNSSSPGEKPIIMIATPLFNMQGKRTGVLASRIFLNHIDRIILERTGPGTSGKTYLVERSGWIISESPLMKNSISSQPVGSEGIAAALRGNDGSGFYRNYERVQVVWVYRWVDHQDMALIAEMSQEEALAPARDLALPIFYIGVLLSIILAAVMYLLTRQITRPILEITDAAAQVTVGDLNREAPVMTEDEVDQTTCSLSSVRMPGKGF